MAKWEKDVGFLSRFHLSKHAAKLRGKDNWEGIYRVASGVSPFVANQTLKFLPNFTNESEDFDTYLLTSLRKLFSKHDLMEKGGHLGSEMIITSLNEDNEAPWYSEYQGRESKGLTREKLSRRLRRYKVTPEQHWHPDIQEDVRGSSTSTCPLKMNNELTPTLRLTPKQPVDPWNARLKNTASELSQYDERITKLLDQIFDEYGLIICGWSAQWDHALRTAMDNPRRAV